MASWITTENDDIALDGRGLKKNDLPGDIELQPTVSLTENDDDDGDDAPSSFNANHGVCDGGSLDTSRMNAEGHMDSESGALMGSETTGCSTEQIGTSVENALSAAQPVSVDGTPLNLENQAASTKSPLSASQSALVRRLIAIRERRKTLSARQKVAVLIGCLPILICSLEMIPERCRICRKDTEIEAYFFTAAICGGFAAVIFGDSLNYWMPRLVGGSVSALGSLFTIWMLLTSIPTKLAFLFFFVGFLGAMPGVVIYFLLKIAADECFASNEDDENYYDEIAPLTKIRITSAS